MPKNSPPADPGSDSRAGGKSRSGSMNEDGYVSPRSINPFINQLYANCWAELCRFIKVRFGDGPPEPEDVAQQAFTQFAALDDPKKIDNPRAFLFRTATNITIDDKRRQKRQARLLQMAYPNRGEEAHSNDSEPVRVMLGKEEYSTLRQTFEAMPEKRRQLFLLQRLHGMSYVELAEISGLSATTVKYHVAMALADCSGALSKGELGVSGDAGNQSGSLTEAEGTRGAI
jgi:RNA polymerase sigma factor (sigma-70 family)